MSTRKEIIERIEIMQAWVDCTWIVDVGRYAGVPVDIIIRDKEELDLENKKLECWNMELHKRAAEDKVEIDRQDKIIATVYHKGWWGRLKYFDIKWDYGDTVPNKLLRGNLGGCKYFITSVGKGEWVAETMEDAKQMAIDFNEGVS